MKKEINDLLNSIDDYIFDSISNNEIYFYNGISVPRVTEILSAMLHEDYLMSWSNAMGFRRKKYEDILQEASNIGTITHNAIEEYIKNGIDFDNLEIIQAQNSFNAFKKWWSIIIQTDYKILMQEQKMTCRYFGGTLDLLIQINGKIYLVDFKTSNHLSYKYILQLSAYIYLLKENYNIDVDGCIILRLDKKTSEFEELIYHLSDYDTNILFDIAMNEFFTLYYSYIHRLYIQQQFDNRR